MLTLLEEKHNAILALYDDHFDILSEIQNTLYNKILPSLVRDLHLDDDTGEWLKAWIADQGSIFRMFKKHKFDLEKTIDSSACTLRWRAGERKILQSFPEQDSVPKCIQNLPITTRDIFGRPAVLIRPSMIQNNNVSEIKKEMIHVYEKVRQQMAFRHHFQESGCFQFVMIIDSKNTSFSSSILDIITWFVREVAPRFPGMCAAAFVINYTKPYSLHSFVKRLLPANARARIYFPDASELNSCFTRPLHFDTEGNFDDSILDVAHMNAVPPPVAEEECSRIVSESSNSSNSGGNLSRLLPSMSVFNPYFGYPVINIPGLSAPLLRNGRRRKRDLARTLIRLWLVKLKRLTDKTWLWILMTIALWGVGLMENKQL